MAYDPLDTGHAAPARSFTFLSRIAAVLLASGISPALGQGCLPGDSEIAIFDGAGFQGACAILGAGHYAEPAGMGFPNDAISSIRVGPKAAGFLCQASNFQLKCQRFTEDTTSLAGSKVGDNTTSSARVVAGQTGCMPGMGEVSFYRHANYTGFCTTLGEGYYFDPFEMDFLNDTLSSVRLGDGATVELFPGNPVHGQGTVLWQSDPDLTNNLIGNDQMSSAVVYAGDVHCFAGINQVALFAHANHQGPCSVLNAGLYRTPVHTGLPNDSVSSIRIGDGAAAYVCQHSDLGGTCEGFAASDARLDDNTIGNDNLSSLVVGPLKSLGYVEQWARQNVIASANYGLAPKMGKRQDVVVILYDPHRPGHPRISASALYNSLMDSGDSVARYFSEASGNMSTINVVGMFGWHDAPAAKQGMFYWNYADPDDSLDGDGFRTGHTMRWVDAVRELDRHFDFAPWDKNGDGKLTKAELGIVIITPGTDLFGAERDIVSNQFTGAALELDGVELTRIVEIHPGSPLAGRNLIAHEIGHIAFDLLDMYFITWPPGAASYEWYHPFAARSFSLMGDASRYAHIDPATKLKLGWAVPQVVTEAGYYSLGDVETGGEVLVLLDPAHGFDEYFILENRWPGTSFDASIQDTGLAIWHVIENNETNTALPMPTGVPVADWNTIKPNLDWPRRAIRMIRAGGLNPPALANDTQALYDVASGSIGLNWADGTASGFTVRLMTDASAVDPVVTVQVSRP